MKDEKEARDWRKEVLELNSGGNTGGSLTYERFIEFCAAVFKYPSSGVKLAERIADANNEVIKVTLLHCQVCSKLDEAGALAWLRSAMPAGTQNNWQLSNRPELKAVECSEDSEKHHYMFTC